MKSTERITVGGIDAPIQTSGNDILGIHTEATHLMLAAAVGDISCIHQRMYSEFEMLDFRGWHALSFASACNKLEAVKMLVFHEPMFISMGTYEGHTPMMLAAHNGHIGIVDFLIRMGGSVYCQDTKGYTALHFAVVRGHLDIVKLIIAHSAAIVHTKEFIHGWDALTMAVKENKGEIVLTMLRSPDISVDSIDNMGYTPLRRILKVFDVNPEVCSALIVHGASLENIHVSYNNHKRIIQEALFQRDLVPVRQMLLASTPMPVVLLDIIAAYSCVRLEEQYKPCKRKTKWFRLIFKCFPLIK